LLAGALVALMLCVGLTVPEILERTLNLDVESYIHLDLMSLMTKYGLSSLEPVKKVLVKLCGKDPLFKDLPIKLHVTSFCLDTGETEYFSKDTVPDGRVIDFVCMSVAVPFLFESVRYQDRLYVDGGITECCPMACFLGKNPKEVLAVRLVCENKPDEKIDTLRKFVTRLIKSSIRCVEYTGLTVMRTTLDVFDFKMKLEDRLKLYFLS
jgi:predicted acylesterase/phospholipase RssA